MSIPPAGAPVGIPMMQVGAVNNELPPWITSNALIVEQDEVKFAIPLIDISYLVGAVISTQDLATQEKPGIVKLTAPSGTTNILPGLVTVPNHNFAVAFNMMGNSTELYLSNYHTPGEYYFHRNPISGSIITSDPPFTSGATGLYLKVLTGPVQLCWRRGSIEMYARFFNSGWSSWRRIDGGAIATTASPGFVQFPTEFDDQSWNAFPGLAIPNYAGHKFAAGTDLDTIKDPGFYRMRNTVTSAQERPFVLNRTNFNCGVLVVAAATTGRVQQTLYHNNGQIWHRVFQVTSWTPWSQVITAEWRPDNGADLNSYTNMCEVSISTSPLHAFNNAPPDAGEGQFYLKVMSLNSSSHAVRQILYKISSGEIWSRHRLGNVWYPWQRIDIEGMGIDRQWYRVNGHKPMTLKNTQEEVLEYLNKGWHPECALCPEQQPRMCMPIQMSESELECVQQRITPKFAISPEITADNTAFVSVAAYPNPDERCRWLIQSATKCNVKIRWLDWGKAWQNFNHHKLYKLQQYFETFRQEGIEYILMMDATDVIITESIEMIIKKATDIYEPGTLLFNAEFDHHIYPYKDQHFFDILRQSGVHLNSGLIFGHIDIFDTVITHALDIMDGIRNKKPRVGIAAYFMADMIKFTIVHQISRLQ